MKNEKTENEDYYFTEQGFVVFTAKYLLDRGYCCGHGCRHCPYEKAPATPPESAPPVGGRTLKEPDN